MKAVEILKGALALIEDKSRWCRGYLAVDKNGKRRGVFDDEACGFCAIGAVAKVSDNPLEATTRAMERAILALDEEAWRLYGRGKGTEVVNDVYGHDATLDLFRRAIKNLEGGK